MFNCSFPDFCCCFDTFFLFFCFVCLALFPFGEIIEKWSKLWTRQSTQGEEKNDQKKTKRRNVLCWKEAKKKLSFQFFSFCSVQGKENEDCVWYGVRFNSQHIKCPVSRLSRPARWSPASGELNAWLQSQQGKDAMKWNDDKPRSEECGQLTVQLLDVKHSYLGCTD